MQRLITILIIFGLLYACAGMFKGSESPATKERTSTAYSFHKNAATRSILVQEAQKCIGSKYKYGGTSPKGFDCSGFVSYVYKKVDIAIPRSSAVQAQKGTKITQGAAQAGDLLFFRLAKKGKTSHVAMVVSNDAQGMEIIHSTTSRGVIQENIGNSKYWQENLMYGRRYLP